MPIPLLSLILLAMAALPLGALWTMRRSRRDGWLYLLASVAILLFTASVLVWAPAAYDVVGGIGFMPESPGKGSFDTQSYSGFLQILFGVPVAVAGSLYAILLARQSERQSTLFNAYELRRNFRDRLDQRNAIIGHFARALRDINNTSYILLGQVERALAQLPSEQTAAESAVVRIRSEAASIDQGIALLRAAIEDFRDATIDVRDAGISLDLQPRAPLGTIGWQFFGCPAPGSVSSPRDGSQPVEDGQVPPAPQDLVNALLNNDYHAAADRFLIRAHQLNSVSMVRVRLERFVHSLVRWSESVEFRQSCPRARDVVLQTAEPSADIFGHNDYIGFRFIGSALMRADNAVDRDDGWRNGCRVDFGAAVLLDAFLALPKIDQAKRDIRLWDEWVVLGDVIEPALREQLLTSVPDPTQHFSAQFCHEMRAIQHAYTYHSSELSIAERRRLAEQARLEHFALVHHMPPSWMEGAFDTLARAIMSETPPVRASLAAKLASMAVAIHIQRIHDARPQAIAAIDLLLESMDGEVEREFLSLGDDGAAYWRRCVLVRWILRPDQRGALREAIEQQLVVTSAPTQVLQLRLDLVDCCLALGQESQALEHFAQARDFLTQLPDEVFYASNWFIRNQTNEARAWISRDIVLFGVWLTGYLMKRQGAYWVIGPMDQLSEGEITMPRGLLPLFWISFVREGLLTLPTEIVPHLRPDTESSCGVKIDPQQCGWTWDPGLLTEALGRLEVNAVSAGESIPEHVINSFNSA